ncbi:MAG TPA: hypothetical protein VNU19_16910 [Candidatus Acidoferrum sp.]|jgi:hypothetical protein|nr:hypothetical protein [Candidatus Acidoferrum sp.]
MARRVTSPNPADLAARSTRRVVPTLAVSAAIISVALVLSSCGGGGANALGDQACTHVERSLTLFRQASHAVGTKATALEASANDELRSALRPASLAASQDGADWQALAATISESSRVAESDLVHALSDECAASPAGPRST